jgi:hypothetical protein
VRVEPEKKGLWLPPAKVDLFGNAIYTRKRTGAIRPPTNCPKSLMFASVYGENLAIHFFLCATRSLETNGRKPCSMCQFISKSMEPNYGNLWNQKMVDNQHKS